MLSVVNVPVSVWSWGATSSIATHYIKYPEGFDWQAQLMFYFAYGFCLNHMGCMELHVLRTFREDVNALAPAQSSEDII